MILEFPTIPMYLLLNPLHPLQIQLHILGQSNLVLLQILQLLEVLGDLQVRLSFLFEGLIDIRSCL